MTKYRTWIFRVLVISFTSLMIISWSLPWWMGSASGIGDVEIYPYGLYNSLGSFEIMIAEAEMPSYFAPLMWTYLGLCLAALLFSLFAKRKEFKITRKKFALPSFIVGLVGFSYIVVAIVAVIVIAIRTGDFNMPLIGEITVTEAPPVVVTTNLQFGYYLAYGAGVLLMILALFSNKITSKPKVNTDTITD